MKKLIIVATVLFYASKPFAQTSMNLKVNKAFPEFTFNDVKYCKKSTVSFKDFRGQWLVLDFWNRYCEVCLARMPHTDSLSKEFKSVNFLMVGYTGSRYTHKSDNQAIHKLYPILRQRLNISLPIAYDSLLFHQFNIGACPYIIIIDPKGMIREITTGFTKMDLERILSGKNVSLEKAFNRNGK